MFNQENRIRELREEKNMTQIRLSTELAVSQETISAYENGKHYPKLESLFQMSELFNVSMDYIMGVSPVRNAIPKDSLPDNEVRMLLLYRKLDGVKQERAFSYMQGLAVEN
jgi:transcriptional regulator with XRE-family HTH domain